MDRLVHLVREVCAGVEVYFTGHTGGQYLRTAFLLCDDYTELASKLFLLKENPQWSDQDGPNHYKNYHKVLTEVHGVFTATRPADAPAVKAIHDRMTAHRERRNSFFHSTSLLGLTVDRRMCAEAFCDLLDYGTLLFLADWTSAVAADGSLATLEVLVRLEKASVADPSLTHRVGHILEQWPRNIRNAAKSGVHLAQYPDDLHLRLCVIWGGQELRDKLRALLPAAP